MVQRRLTHDSIVYGTKVYVKEMSSYIAMIYRVSHRFGNSTDFWPGNVWSWEKKVALSGLKMKRLYWTYLWMFGISFIIKGKKALLKSQWTMKHLNFLNINYFSNTCSFDSLRSLTYSAFVYIPFLTKSD